MAVANEDRSWRQLIRAVLMAAVLLGLVVLLVTAAVLAIILIAQIFGADHVRPGSW